MKRYFLLTAAALVLLISGVSGQDIFQNIRGVVLDKQSQSPMIGVAVVLLDGTNKTAAITDLDGKFTLTHVPIGRVGVRFSMLGYAPVEMNNLSLDAGKELVLNISLEESVKDLKEVVVSAETDKREAINEMATVSARSFSIEETKRYAGSLEDPSRMATNFAGVAVAGDSRNDIVIRGNSPMGLLWRLDGINIPNPNHFGSLGTTGGPVSILNNNLLDNSDFMTGAFPAEYGNALSGAFDLKMRAGNNEKHEFLGQVGFNGFELGAEGPLTKSHKGSYLASYRYSTLELLNDIGLHFGYGSIPQYQDVSFKLDLPAGVKYGRFSLFGIGGKSYIELLDKDKRDGDFTVSGFAEDTYYGSDMGVLGFSHKYFFNENTSQTINLAASGVQNSIHVDSLYNDKTEKLRIYGNKSYELKYTLAYSFNKKLNSKNTFNGGFNADLYHYHYADSVLRQNSYYRTLTNFDGNSELIQVYAKWQHRFSDALTLNTGVHYQELMLNHTYAAEPRLGLKWMFAPQQSFSLGFGMHSQLQPMGTYFYKTELGNGAYTETNRNLEFTKSNHYVFAYDNSFALNWRIKVEAYYQDIYNVPVETKPSAFSILNTGADYVITDEDSLINGGSGRNTGLEFTLEKFFSKNYYFLLTASVYDAKYKGSDGVERNSAFNGNFTFNLLAGAEFHLNKAKTRLLTVNGKINYAGGKRYVPILLDESRAEGQAVYDKAHSYENQYAAYSRFDLKIGYKMNGKKITQEWAFDIQNVLDRKNIFQKVYNPVKQDIQTEYQLGFFPMMTYRIMF